MGIYLVNLIVKSVTCKVYDYESILVSIDFSAYLHYLDVDACFGPPRDIKLEYHELCSKNYFMEL